MQHLRDPNSNFGNETGSAGEWGVYVFPECEITVTGYHEDVALDPAHPTIVYDYEVSYPVTDTGTGYEFICSICYPDIVSSEGSLSGRIYTLIDEEWNDPDAANPRVACTYQDEFGDTYTVGNLNDPSETNCVYDTNGNPAFVIMENVRLYIPYENTGDLYDAFIGPALDGTLTQFNYELADCFKVRFDENGVMQHDCEIEGYQLGSDGICVDY